MLCDGVDMFGCVDAAPGNTGGTDMFWGVMFGAGVALGAGVIGRAGISLKGLE